MNIHSVGNAIEAGVWFVLAAVVFVAGLRRVDVRRIAWSASGTLVLFGLSDLVEITTGAWWRPWWLLVWKGSCIVALAALLWLELKRRKTDGAVSDDESPAFDDESSE